MSVKLALASLWLPPWVVRRELERVAAATTSALDRLVAQTGAAVRERTSTVAGDAGSVRRRRAAMARGHTERVARLVDLLGRGVAIARARGALFDAGVKMGHEARERLGVGSEARDLLRAARILYRVLGIRFRAQWTTEGTATVRIDRCALSRDYSADVCLALSAADAGVVAGLWPGARLEFDERITEGRGACIARLALPEAGAKGER